MNTETGNMTKPVIIKASGKVVGIKGLYQDPSSKRLYIRYSYHGIDRQMTIYPKNMTFSELQRAASKAMTELKKSVMAMAPAACSVPKADKSAIDYGIERLRDEISRHWGCKGTSQKYIAELLRVTDGLAVCTSKRQSDIASIDRHNKEIARSTILDSKLTQCQKFKRYYGIRQCFDEMISMQVHHGINPVAEIPRPVYVQGRRTEMLSLEDSARIILAIRKSGGIEMELFFRLCVETGQRPKDVYMFDALKIHDRHYQFRSHKTRRGQRVEHLISDPAISLIGRIILGRGGVPSYDRVWENKHGIGEQFTSFWSLAFNAMTRGINKFVHSVVGDDVSLYAAKHFFITEMFRRTGSEFWAEVFTHEGKNVNQRNYLHPEQKKADEILSSFCMDFESMINKQKETKQWK